MVILVLLLPMLFLQSVGGPWCERGPLIPSDVARCEAQRADKLAALL